MNIHKSLRIIFRNKTYSLLNIAGLAIGITAAALIFLWVESKVNYNKAIPNSQNLYIAGIHSGSNSGEISTAFNTSNPLHKTLQDEFPEVKRSMRYRSSDNKFTLENTTTSFEERGAYADSTIFEMIGITLLNGLPSTVFSPHNPIVISETMAKKLYQNEVPIGKGLIYNDQLYEITGVFKDMPKNTAFEFDWLIPFLVFEQEMGKFLIIDSWGTSWLETYVELEPYVDVNLLNEKLNVLPMQKEGPTYDKTNYFVYPVNRTLLYGEFKDGMDTGGGYIRTVRLFFIIGILILVIACINFMNLSTARSQKRALEVGIHKTFGIRRKYIIGKFLAESGMITTIALLISIAMIFLCLPFFNNLIDAKLSFDFTNPYIVCGLLAIGLFCTFTAGSYPAFYLSSFKPITTLKMQKVSKGQASWIRQILVVFQFTMAFILICTTFVIYLQIRLAQNRDLGIQKENLVLFQATNELITSYHAVQNELQNTGVVASSGFSHGILLSSLLRANPWYWNGKDPNSDDLITVNYISEGLIDAAGLQLIEGTDINPNRKDSEGRVGVLINESLAHKMGEEGRIGGKIGQSPDAKFEIVGIVKNYIFDDLYALEPGLSIFRYRPERMNQLFVRLKPDINTFEAIGKVQSVLRTFTPNHTFEPTLMTDRFKRMFESESLIEKLSALFATLAIIISCLGLLGLSAFSAEQRTKEIGIRKVLGAKTTHILVLLGKAYMILLAISFVIGIPISLYITNHYLRDYAFRITLSWDIFAAVALFITLISLLTVSSLSLRAAVSNPVRSIKME